MSYKGDLNADLGLYFQIDESPDSSEAASTMSAQMSSATESLGIDDETVEAVVGKFSLAWHSLKEVNQSDANKRCIAHSLSVKL